MVHLIDGIEWSFSRKTATNYYELKLIGQTNLLSIHHAIHSIVDLVTPYYESSF